MLIAEQDRSDVAPSGGDVDGRLTLTDGRVLAWRQWGDPSGRPLLRLQGTPGSRLSVPPRHAIWAESGLRVLMTDRPGFGESSRLPGRGIAAVADDYVALLDHLDIERTAVLAVSGGAPHALAFAARHPDRVSAVSVVAGVTPVSDQDALNLVGGNATSYRLAKLGWEAVHEFSEQQRIIMMADPIAGVRAAMLKAPEDDLRVMANSEWQQAHSAGLLEALRPGSEGWTDETIAVLGEWDFDLADVTHHVVWWAGADDANCPVPAVRRFVDRLPSAELRLWQGVGHFAQYLRSEEFLSELIERAYRDPR